MPYEHIVSVVDKEVITYGELLAEARLAWVMRQGESVAYAPMSDDFLQGFLQHLIHQVLLAQDGRRMGTDAISDGDVHKRLNQLVNTFSSQRAYLAFLSSLTMDAAAVRSVMARDVQNDRYITERLRTRLMVHGTQSQEDGKAVNLEVDGGRSHNPQAQKLLRQWLKELRRGAQVRTLDPQGHLRLERP